MLDKNLNTEAFSNPSILFLLSMVSLMMAITIVTQAYLLSTIIDLVFLEAKEFQALWDLLLILLMVFIFRGLLVFMHTKAGAVLACKVKRKLRNNHLDKLEKLGALYMVKKKTGGLVGAVTEGIDQLEPYFSRYLPQIIQALIIPPIILIVVFSHSILSGAIMLITAPLIPLFMYLIGNMAEEKAQKQHHLLFRFSGHFLDVLQGLSTLKIFGRSKEQAKNISIMSKNFRDTSMDVLKVAFLSALMLEILATISIAMIAVEVGLRLVYGNLTFMIAFFILLLTPELYLPLKNLGTSFHAGRTSIGARKEIASTLDKEILEAKWGDKEFPKPLPPQLSIKDINFSYNGETKALSDINLTINPGEKLAIIGESGSGKTTLLKVLMGLLVPQQGEVRVNDTAIYSILEEEWFNQLAYVSQEPYIFSGSIADNIKIGKPDASREEIILAAKRARAHEFIIGLPGGYDTMIGDGYRGLSGGERQRVAIARVFLKKATLVLLDEATAGLDLERERLVQQAITELARGCTLIMVAHRMQTVIGADRIVILRRGQIVTMGNHKELLKTSEDYRKYVTDC